MKEVLKITFQPQAGSDGYVVFLGDDRLGWVRRVGKTWAATDTFMVPAGRSHKTRAAAAKVLRKRFAKAMRDD